MEGGREPEQYAGRQREQRREAEDACVDRDRVVDRDRQLEIGRHEPPEQPVREQQSERSAEDREQDALGQQLADEARPAGAERQPDRDLLAPLVRSGEQQVRDIGAGDQKHDPDDRHQDHRDLNDLRAALTAGIQTRVEQRHGAGAAALVVGREGLFELAEDRLEVCPGLLDADAGLQAPEREEEQAAAGFVPVEVRLHDVVHRHRNPQGRSAAEQRAGESPGRHTHDGERRAIQRHGLADDRGIAAKAALPEPMTQDGDRRRLLVLFGEKAAADDRFRSEQGEVVARNRLHRDWLRLAPGAPVHLREGERRHAGEHLVLLAKVLVVEVRERQVARIALVRREDRREPRGFRDRNGTQQQDVDEAEDRGVGANAERQ